MDLDAHQTSGSVNTFFVNKNLIFDHKTTRCITKHTTGFVHNLPSFVQSSTQSAKQIVSDDPPDGWSAMNPPGGLGSAPLQPSLLSGSAPNKTLVDVHGRAGSRNRIQQNPGATRQWAHDEPKQRRRTPNNHTQKKPAALHLDRRRRKITREPTRGEVDMQKKALLLLGASSSTPTSR